MSPNIMAELVDEIPCDSRICHYDELSEDAKEELPAITESSNVLVDKSTADGFGECDLVKYTDYYEISIL